MKTLPSNNSLAAISRWFRSAITFTKDQREIAQITTIVFADLFDISKTDLITQSKKTLSESKIVQLIGILKKINAHIPLAQAIGSTTFCEINIKVNAHTLIPRPETEELVYLIYNYCNKNKIKSGNILDIGTGSGCIPLALKKMLHEFYIEGWDISKDAIGIAQENAKNLQLDVSFKLNDIFHATTNESYQIIVSNPPYIPLEEKKDMEKIVTENEPHIALFVPNEDPLIFYKRIAEFGREHLKPNGQIFFEIHHQFGQKMLHLMRELKYVQVQLIKDINGKDRFIQAQKQ